MVLTIPSAHAQVFRPTNPDPNLAHQTAFTIAQGTPTKDAADRAFAAGVEALQAGENQWETAVQHLERAVAVYEQLNMPDQQAAALGNLGVAFRIGENYTASLAHLEQAYALMKQTENVAGEWTALQQLALTYRALGNTEKALNLLQEQLALSERQNNQSWIAQALANLGLIYMDSGENAAARQAFERQIEIANRLGDQALAERGRSNLALLHVDANPPRDQLEADIDRYEAIRAEQLKSGDLIAAGYTSGDLGLLYRQRGRRSGHHKALRAFEEYLSSTRARNDLREERVALHNMGVVLYELGQESEAETVLWQAIELSEQLREDLADINRISIFNSHLASYSVQQLVLVAQKRWSEALEVSERGRARAFADLLLTRTQTNTPTVSALLTAPNPTLEALQNLARTEQAVLVEYSLVESEHSNPDLLIWVIQPSGKVDFRQVDLSRLSTPLDELIQAIQWSIGDRSRGGFAVVPEDQPDPSVSLRQLHQLLIEPISDLLPITPDTPIIFAPHEELFLVPFPALLNDQGQYLIENHTLLTVPSFQVLSLTQQQNARRGSPSNTALIVGNPKMPELTETKWSGLPLASLPNAETEAISVGQILQAPTLLQDNATETTIRQQLPQATLAHFATHGLLDYGTINDSIPGAIVLSADAKNDGLLTASEILDLQIISELVVLSACDTGLGSISGDGVNGLMRSFLLAGAANVIVSLWSVPDAPTADLMTEFYRQWQQNGLDKAQALRQAMLITLATHPDPKNWAAFTLVGSAQ